MKLYFKLSICILLSLQIQAQNNKAIESLLNDFIGADVFENAHISLNITSLKTNATLISYNDSKPFIPASSLKLITNYSALKTLGPDFKYETRIYTTGEIQYDGTLRGNIIIEAGGDPTLGSNNFKGVKEFDALLQELSKTIRDLGITCIDGNIIVDISYFDEQGPVDSWQWNDIANYYAGGAWSLNVHENMYYIHFDRNKKINKLSELIKVDPEVPLLEIQNEVKVAKAGTGDNAYVYGGPKNYSKIIRGTIPKGKSDFKIKAALPDPPYFFAYHLKNNLLESGVSTNNIIVGNENIKSKKLIKRIKSPNLERIVYMSNVESNNLYSETLFKTLAKKQFNSAANELGIESIKRILKSYDIDPSQYKAVDGSGLSRANKISSQLMSRFLSKLGNDIGVSNLCKLLARPGKKGTSKHILRDFNYADKIWLKTGSMGAVQSYSGYIQAQDKSWYSFCIIANDFSLSNSIIRNNFDKFISDIYLQL